MVLDPYSKKMCKRLVASDLYITVCIYTSTFKVLKALIASHSFIGYCWAPPQAISLQVRTLAQGSHSVSTCSGRGRGNHLLQYKQYHYC